MSISSMIGNDISLLQSMKAWLSKNFSMKNLKEATYILGIKNYKDISKRLLGLSQSIYIDTILKSLSMANSKHGNVPTQPGMRRKSLPKGSPML